MAYAGRVRGRADLLVAVYGQGEMVDRLVPVRLPCVQDASVFGRGGLSPRVGVVRGGPGEAVEVLAARPRL